MFLGLINFFRDFPLAGPYRVLRRNKDKYTFEDLVDTHTFDVHVSRLTPFIYDAQTTDPTAIAIQGEYKIDAVLAHQGDRKNRNTMQFLIRWDPSTGLEDSWEPWKNLRQSEPVIEYCRRNKLKALVQHRT